MKIPFFSLLFFSLLLSCQPKTGKVNAPEEMLQTDQGPMALKVIDRTAFDNIADASTDQSLANRFCSESKGYQQKVWLGLNKCSWAIEQYMIDQLAPLVQRNGDRLSLQLTNGTTIDFNHQQEQGKEVYYQFKKYFPQHQCFLIEALRESGCPTQLLVDVQNGNQFPLSGLIAFAPASQQFALWNTTEHCSPALEVWQIKSGTPTKAWSSQQLSGSLSTVKWISANSLALQLASSEGAIFRTINWEADLAK